MSWNMTNKEKAFRKQIRNTIGSNIRSMRKAAGMTQIELAKKIDKSEPQIVKWENGKTDIKVADMLILLDLFKSDMTLDEFAGR